MCLKACAELIICGQDKKRNFMVLICDVLTLITTLVVNCSEAKSALAINVSMEKGKSSSLMQVLLDLINDVNLGDNLIRSRIWIPNSFRIITARYVLLTLIGMRQGTFHPLSFWIRFSAAVFLSKISKLFWRCKLTSIG